LRFPRRCSRLAMVLLFLFCSIAYCSRLLAISSQKVPNGRTTKHWDDLKWFSDKVMTWTIRNNDSWKRSSIFCLFP
jgi:hypothetical protein